MIAEVKDLTRKDYELIRRLVYAKSGINLGTEKMQLVRARLGKRVRQDGFKSFRDYYRHVEQDPTGERLCELLDAISFAPGPPTAPGGPIMMPCGSGARAVPAARSPTRSPCWSTTPCRSTPG